jgi:hypothetical protein
MHGLQWDYSLIPATTLDLYQSTVYMFGVLFANELRLQIREYSYYNSTAAMCFATHHGRASLGQPMFMLIKATSF